MIHRKHTYWSLIHSQEKKTVDASLSIVLKCPTYLLLMLLSMGWLGSSLQGRTCQGGCIICWSVCSWDDTGSMALADVLATDTSLSFAEE